MNKSENENKKVIGYRWTAKLRGGGSTVDGPSKGFTKQEDCYRSMLDAVADKLKWNVGWDDVNEVMCEPDADGVVRNTSGFSTQVDFRTYMIVMHSHSGEYVYEVEPIAVSEEEAARLAAVKAWATHMDGNDGGILGVTNAYTICPDDAWEEWEKVCGKWDCGVPPCPEMSPDAPDLDDVVLNLHLEIQPLADEVNREIEEGRKAREYKNTAIFAVYLVDGELRGYQYRLDNLNDVENFFEDELSLYETYVLCVNADCNESRYFRKEPVAKVREMVVAACDALHREQAA